MNGVDLNRMIRIPGWTVVLAAALCLSAVSCPMDALGQQRVTREQAQRQMERAEEAYQRLLSEISGPAAGTAATDPRLRSALRAVEEMINRSGDSFHHGNYNATYALAGEALERIAKIAGELRRLERRLQLTDRLIEQSREALELLRRRARLEQINERTSRMLEMAFDTFHRAVRARDGGDLLISYKLIEQTGDLVKKLIKEMGSQAISPERLLRDLELTDEMLSEVSEILAETGQSQSEAALKRAETVQEQARNHYEEGNSDFARRLTLRARTLARLSLRLSDRGPLTEAERILGHTDNLIDRYGDKIRESGNTQAIGLLENAIALQEEAWDSFHDEQIEGALTRTRAAAKLVNAANLKAFGAEEF